MKSASHAVDALFVGDPTGPIDENAAAPSPPMALVDSASPHAAQLARARAACAALDGDDALQLLMSKLLDTVESRVQQANVGLRPALPDRHKYLHKLAASNARRPQRAAAYAAMDSLLGAIWVPLTVAERKKRCEKRKLDVFVPNYSEPDPTHPVPVQPKMVLDQQPLPWSDSLMPLCFEPDPEADSLSGPASKPWWRRLERMGLSPGNPVAINRNESNRLAAVGRDCRDSV